MQKLAPNSEFVGHSTEIIQQSKFKGPLTSAANLIQSSQNVLNQLWWFAVYLKSTNDFVISG